MTLEVPLPDLRHDWTVENAATLLAAPFSDLLAEAQATHRAWWDPNVVEGAMLLSIKTGACPEDCAYCPQSAQWSTGLQAQPLMDAAEIVASARKAKDAGATRFCLGAAWRSPSDAQVAKVADAVEQVGALGMETCCWKLRDFRVRENARWKMKCGTARDWCCLAELPCRPTSEFFAADA